MSEAYIKKVLDLLDDKDIKALTPSQKNKKIDDINNSDIPELDKFILVGVISQNGKENFLLSIKTIFDKHS